MNRITSNFLSWAIRTIIQLGGYTEMFDKIRETLSGKKTYLVAVGMIVNASLEYIASGNMGMLINRVIEAVAFMTVRAGIAKAEPK